MIRGLTPQQTKLNLPDSDIDYFPGFLAQKMADESFTHFMDHIEWKQDHIRVFGKTYPQPRLTALYGNNEKPYTYSNITMQPIPFNEKLLHLKQLIEPLVDVEFSSCLLNLYRDGMDSNGWHSDDEKALGRNPVIASLSLGQSRTFHLKHKKRKEIKFKLLLGHGSLLLMQGATQHHWQHQIAKSRKPLGPRINLTFRCIK
ncbi:MAG: alpha-ketoglutarate-dependent dioxygenase AlkB family protein [Flavobacteriaceae bacterium]